MGKNALAEIKCTLDGYIGQKIRLKANSGRRKTIERTGILEATYPSVFVVRLDEEQHAVNRVSYSYSDVWSKNVHLMIQDDVEDEFVPVQYVKI